MKRIFFTDTFLIEKLLKSPICATIYVFGWNLQEGNFLLHHDILFKASCCNMLRDSDGQHPLGHQNSLSPGGQLQEEKSSAHFDRRSEWH